MMSGEVRTAATVIDAQIGVVGQNEIPCLVVSFKTNDSRFQTIAAKIFFTPAAEKQAAKSLTALGWNPEANNWNIDALISTNALIGRDASLVVEEQEYNGNLRWEVKWINSTTGSILKKVFGSEERKALSEQIRARNAPAANTGRGIARPGQQAQGQTQQTNTDGLPF